MRTRFLLAILFLALTPLSSSAAPPKQRNFQLNYGATLTDLKPGARLRVWIPVPRNTRYQRITWRKLNFPGPIEIHRETKYGNKILYFAAAAPSSGRLKFGITYDVRRREVAFKRLATTTLKSNQQKLFTSANRLVPVTNLPLTIGKPAKSATGLVVARSIYDLVGTHMRYDKSKPGYGNGDTLWACDSRFGNCTDFHSLFISLARNNKIPSRFEIGLPLPTKRGSGKIGGYHCWASFHTKRNGWVPVDISEADKHPKLNEYYFGNLTENRVSFSIGRDLTLVPKQASAPLNYFVYPHVEVDGKGLPKRQVTLEFSYQDEGKRQ